MSQVVSDRAIAHRNPEPAVVTQFKRFYSELVVARIDEMGAIYDSDIVFRDPVHDVRGITDLHIYMLDICKNLKYCRFEFIDQIIGQNSGYIKWNMVFAHAKLGGEKIVVRGVSHIEFTQRIHFHEDIYDLGAMLYEHLPVMGLATRWLKRRLANGGKA